MKVFMISDLINEVIFARNIYKQFSEEKKKLRENFFIIMDNINIDDLTSLCELKDSYEDSRGGDVLVLHQWHSPYIYTYGHPALKTYRHYIQAGRTFLIQLSKFTNLYILSSGNVSPIYVEILITGISPHVCRRDVLSFYTPQKFMISYNERTKKLYITTPSDNFLSTTIQLKLFNEIYIHEVMDKLKKLRRSSDERCINTGENK